ncbi:MAG: CRISPR system precrRNA processing endoribonuclease RAMP protein Cas6 [Desulfurococcales archaeon]|nr:CRISPR system precrRNA processing endoribonuclease RAMP protein Cas6 [Desulfurococcales archaeon]
MKPFFKSLFEDVDGHIIKLKIRFRFESDTILPPFTSKLTKTLIYSADCFKELRRHYELRKKFRPVTLSTLHYLSGRSVYKKESSKDGDKPLVAKRDMVLEAYISYYTSKDPFDLGEVFGCSGNLPSPFEKVVFSVDEAMVEKVDLISTGLPNASAFRVEFKTPLIMSTKVMTPPFPKIKTILDKTPNEYRLLPTPAYIAASAMRLWLAIVKGVDPDEYFTPYAIGRLADVLLPEINYRLKPVTVIYGRDEAGRLRKIRGVEGYVVYKINSRKLALTLDKLLGLASRLGLGKNRSIGFGEIKVNSLISD